MDIALGVAGKARIVGHHADGRAFAVQVLQQLHHRFAVARIEVSGRLVGEQDGGRTGQRAGHSHALLLTAGELRRIVLACGAPCSRARAIPARGVLRSAWVMPGAVGQRQLNILVDRQVADQVEALKDKPDLLVADARTLGEVQVLDRRGR